MTLEGGGVSISAEVAQTAAWPAEKIRNFGLFGPKSQVGPLLRQIDGGNWMASITLVDSGEVTEYMRSRMLEDPLAP